jgi:GT2 family glycosyltransferase
VEEENVSGAGLPPGAPKISVVVPTRNRRAWALRLLDALRRERALPGGFEVLVVVNGSSDDTAEALARFEAPFPLRVIETPRPGAAAARNLAASEARGELLVFLDDDTIPEPGLLAAHAAAHEGREAVAAVGPSYPVHDGRVDFFRALVRNWWEDHFAAGSRPDHRFNYQDILAGNFSIRKELFDSLGGYPVDFDDCDGEDWEMGIRLVRRGVGYRFVPEARAVHYEHETMTLDRSFERARRSARGDVRISLYYPEFRRGLPVPRATGFLGRVPVLLAVHTPVLGPRIVRSLRPGLRVLQAFRMRRSWRALYDLIRTCAYWRGYAEERKSLGLPAGFPPRPPSARGADVVIDLEGGIEEAERVLDLQRPASARVLYGSRPVGTIPARPGAEPLRGAHLRALLAGPLAEPLLRAVNGHERFRDRPGPQRG